MIRGLRALLRSRQADADVDAEIAHYLDEATAHHEARGLAPEAAHRAARLELGGAVAAREAVRASGWEHAIETTIADVRDAARRLRRDPGFTLTAVATLAIGIGASTAVFSVVHPILIEPLPYPDAARLVTVDDRTAEGVPMDPTLGTFDELRARARAFDALAAVDSWRPSLTGSEAPEQIDGRRIGPGYLDLLGGVPIAGRAFTAADDERGGPAVVIIGHALAERRFQDARAAAGRDLELDGRRYHVVGVLPQGFVDVLSPTVEIWAPLRERAPADPGGREWGHHYRIVARLAAGTTVDAAQRELLALGQDPVAEFPRPVWASLANGLLVRPLQRTVTQSIRPALYAIVVSVVLVLAIAAVNVANLLLARGARRSAEVAMQQALGASRSRLVRQILTESVVLAVLGGAVGLGVAWLGVAALVAAGPAGLPRLDAIRLDGSVFAFAAAVTTAVGLITGLVPARSALGRAGAAGVPRGSRAMSRRHGLRGALVVAEVALAIALLVNAGLLFRSVRVLLSVEPGFDPAHVVTLQIVQAGPAFASNEVRLEFLDRALASVRALAGVEHAAFTSLLPLSGDVDGYGLEAQSRPGRRGEDGSALRYAVTPDYFETMGIPIVAGRRLAATDRPGAPPVVVINRSLAEQLFGRPDPIGEHIRFGPQMHDGGSWLEIVGVAGDVRHYTLAAGPPNAFYVANGQWEWIDNVHTLVVRTTGAAAPLVPALRQVLRSMSGDVPIRRVRTMDDYVTASAGNRRFALLAIETLAATALVLAIVGLYGVVSGQVAERTREIGIRTALGATPREVIGQVVLQAETLTGAGVVLGLAGGFLGSRLIASMLFGVTARDPITYVGVSAVMAVAAFLAAWAPARRAARVDPVIALRAE
ncbi:MAG: ABC transporter permease [Vicinamibacterales bacterium]